MILADVRALMPKYDTYGSNPVHRRPGPVLGLAIHHSATADPEGHPVGDAHLFFEFQTSDPAQGGYGWDHGAWHYIVRPDGVIEYSLDESIAAYHAGFPAPEPGDVDAPRKEARFHDLEDGQYWNNHYLALCLVGNFANEAAAPSEAQWNALLSLINDLRWRYDIPPQNVRGHWELMQASDLWQYTDCPGAHLDLEALRAQLDQEAPLLGVDWVAILDAPHQTPPGHALALSLVLRNAGNCAWPGAEAYSRQLGVQAQWFDGEGNPVEVTPALPEPWMLPELVRPGQSIALNNVAVYAPEGTGDFTLRFELVEMDGFSWAERGEVHYDLPVRVE